MSTEQALERFENVIGARWPEQFAALQPGLDDAGIDRLRSAVDPFVLPDQVEALYRWRGGGHAPVFGGWWMRPLEDLITMYEFTHNELGEPTIWLPVFDDQIINIVTLDLPGQPPSDLSVWHGDTHDGWVHRLFDSIESLLDVVSDAAEDDRLAVGWGGGLRLRETEESLGSDAWTDLRLRRCPGTYTWPDPPPGTALSRSPEANWPRPWLTAVGVTDESLTLRGATHTIAELLAAAASGQVSGTIRGRVVTGSGGPGWWAPVVSDGSGELVVVCETRVVPITPSRGEEGEFDVVLESPALPEPISSNDPRVAALANRLKPQLPTAVAQGARLL